MLIPPHGGFRKLKSFQASTLVYDLTVEFCRRYVREYRMRDQMVQAARSGRQNIAEGCQASGTSKKTEIKLVSVARASLEELLLDYEDFLRQRKLEVWGKDHSEAREVRRLAYRSDRTNETYKAYLEQPQSAANALICLIHQTNFLLDRQLYALEQQFLQEGGFTERLYLTRMEQRKTSFL
jgi:four helix bundle suffix protein